MDWDLIKKQIAKEIQLVVNTIDPALDIDNCLDLYIKILKFKISIPIRNNLDGLEKSISESLGEYFVDHKINNSSASNFCKNFEQFIKKIYYILEEGEYISASNLLDRTKLQALGPYISALNKIRPIYLDRNNQDVFEIELAFFDNGSPKYKIHPQTGEKMYYNLIPKWLYGIDMNGDEIRKEFRLDNYDDINSADLNNEFQNTFLLYFIKACILKNVQSHQAQDPSNLIIITNLHSTLIAELWIINFFKKELTNSIKKDNIKRNDSEEYIKLEIARLKKQSLKFVSLNLKELTNQSIQGRSGFIENLFLEGNLTRIRILGQGGSGKTTTLEYLLYNDAISWIKDPINSKIPILISLTNLSSTDTIISSIAQKMNVELDYIEELLETNELKIYLDGVNEIVGDSVSKKLKLQEIMMLIEEYPLLNILITDRYELDGYQNNMFNIPTFLIQKIDKSQIPEFVEKYCNYSAELSVRVLDVLNSKSGIQELLLRPLVLTRAIEIIKIEDDLPEKEGQIIEKFLDTLLRREKDDKMDPLLNVNNFKLLLSYAANEIWNEHKTNAPVHMFKFNNILVAAAEKFGLEKFNAGYVTRIGYELEILSKTNDFIQFYHQSYIEFFCKYYLSYLKHSI